MIEAKKYSAAGDQIGTVQLPESLFAVEAKHPETVIYEVIKMYLGNQRQGTAAVKFRSDIKGSGRKLYRQKGTGNARVGNRRTVVRVGGGNAFGPIPKDWTRNIPRKKKRLALKIALSDRAKSGNVYVIEDINFEKPSYKAARQIIEKMLPNGGKKLMLIDGSDVSIVRSFANMTDMKLDRADGVFAYEVLNCEHLILTTQALKKVEEVFGK